MAHRNSDASLASNDTEDEGTRRASLGSVVELEKANPKMPPINAAMGTSFEGRIPKNKPVQGLTFMHKWNTEDFIGSYHRDRFATKHFAVPGTAIVVEETRDRAREDDHTRFEKELAQRTHRRRHRVKVKRESAAMRAQIEMDTMLGVPLDTIENILTDKAENLKPTKRIADTPREIATFFRNIKSGNWNYICYSLTLGFKSINAQDAQGNTPLQWAVRQGDLPTVKELLKFCAEPNFRNILGMSSQHEAWSFWKFHHNRTKEERIEQENKTYDILHCMFTYGGFVDAQDANGETALHFACRLGPVKVVLLILGFKGNVNILTKERTTPSGEIIGNMSPRDVAAYHGRTEIVQLLDAWDRIRHQYILNDFVVVWRKFLKDYEAVITENKDGKQILFELNMEQKVAQVFRDQERGGSLEQIGLPIDDTYMRQTLTESRAAAAPGPKPWERTAWIDFVGKCEEAGIEYHLTQEDRDARKIKRESDAVMEAMGVTKKKKEVVNVDKHLHMTPQELARDRLPDRPKKETHARILKSSGASRGNTAPSGTAGVRLRLDAIDKSKLSPNSRGLGATSPPTFENSRTSSGRLGTGTGTGGDSDDGSPKGERSRSASPTASFGVVDFNTVTEGSAEQEDSFWPVEEEGKRPVSQLGRRRINSARAVGLDAQFYRYTKRPATSSALGLPLRTPDAPLDGTEEESSVLRQVGDQGAEYDLVRKARGKNMRKALGYTTQRPNITPMGDYNTDEKLAPKNAREKLFSRLQAKPMSDREAAENLVAQAAKDQESGKGAAEAKMADQIELINGRRARFVDKVAIPPDRKETGVEKAMKEQKRVQEEEEAKKLGLNGEKMEAARRAMEEKLLSGDVDGVLPDDASLATSTNKERTKSKKDALRQRMIMRATKKVVKYGMNRVTSTHNSFGEIEAPWSTVGGRYAVRAGDRTG